MAGLRPAVALFAAAAAWGWIQTQGWTPVANHHPLWTPAGGGGAIAIDPYAAGTGLLRLLSYAGAFWLGFQHCRSSRRAQLTVEILAAAGGAYAVYGLVDYAAGGETLLWYRRWAYQGYLTATFVNRNSYAAFAGLSLLCAVTAVALRLRGRRPGLVPLLLHLRRPTAGFAVLALLIALSLPASGSRGGVAASALGLSALLLALWANRRAASRPMQAVLALGTFVALVGAAIGLMFLSETFATAAADRQEVYHLALAAIAQRPLLGHGLGSFPAVLQAIRPPALAQIWTEAHNSYLELALELGIPGAACLVLSIGFVAGRCVLALFRAPMTAQIPALGVAALLLIGAHVTIDFSVQIPAVALLWSALLGIAATQSVRSARPQSAPRAAATAAAGWPGAGPRAPRVLSDADKMP
jgi:O-antigen ligase